MVLDDEFNTGSLNTKLWSPDWFGNGNVQNGTIMSSSNVSVGANGLALTLSANPTAGGTPIGGIACSNPDDDQPGHTGFQIAPTPGKPVYVEFKATLPADAAGTVANWPALWLTGRPGPKTARSTSWRVGTATPLPHPLRHRQWHGPREHRQRPLRQPHLRGAVDHHRCHLRLRRGRRRQLD